MLNVLSEGLIEKQRGLFLETVYPLLKTDYIYDMYTEHRICSWISH